MYTIVMALKEQDVKLSLLRDEDVLAGDAWVDKNDLLEQFFVRLDVLLKSNGLSLENVDYYTLQTENPTGYTTTRIAQTIINTLTFAHKKSAQAKKSAQSVDK